MTIHVGKLNGVYSFNGTLYSKENSTGLCSEYVSLSGITLCKKIKKERIGCGVIHTAWINFCKHADIHTHESHLFSVCVCAVSSTCFENINSLQHDWYIWEQSEQKQILCLLTHDFLHKKRWVNAKTCTQLNWPHGTTQNKSPHPKHLPAASVCVMCARSHTCPHLVYNILISHNLFLLRRKNSQAATLWTPPPQEKFGTFSKITFRVYYSTYVFLNHFACAKRCCCFY